MKPWTHNKVAIIPENDAIMPVNDIIVPESETDS